MLSVTVGQIARDKVTGFEGRVTGHASYITGCDQFLVQPKVDEKGNLKDGRWFDEHRLEVVDEQVLALTPSVPDRHGADLPAPVK
jgi:hypothetical protein